MSEITTQCEAKLMPIGPDGILVRFAEGLSDAANRAALAYRGAVVAAEVAGVTEVASSLTSVLVRFRPDQITREALSSQLAVLLRGTDWREMELPSGRRLWKLPVVFGDDYGPELVKVATEVGLSPESAVADICRSRLRVLALGFAPGQPYLGFLAEKWDIPRRKDVTAQVPPGAIVVAVQQVIPFSNAAPTGWKQVGRTPFRCFSTDRPAPVALTAGDEIVFHAVEPAQFDILTAARDGLGGATFEAIQ